VQKTLRDVLTRILWDPSLRKSDYEIWFTHRPMGLSKISAEDLERVTRSTMVLKKGGVIIPLHRVVKVIHKPSGEEIWSKEH